MRFFIKQPADNFYVNANQYSNVVTEMQLIEQPDDLRGSVTQMAALPLNGAGNQLLHADDAERSQTVFLMSCKSAASIS